MGGDTGKNLLTVDDIESEEMKSKVHMVDLKQGPEKAWMDKIF